jgi:hypothetical protein
MRAVGSQIYGHDLKREGVFHILISVVGWHMDGARRFFSLGSLGWDRAREAPWLAARVSSSTSYGARNAMRFDPMQSRTQGEPILQTYGKRNGRGGAGDGGIVRSVLGDSEDGLQRCSSFKEQLYSFALLPSSSSLGQLPQTSMNRACAAAIFVR